VVVILGGQLIKDEPIIQQFKPLERMRIERVRLRLGFIDSHSNNQITMKITNESNQTISIVTQTLEQIRAECLTDGCFSCDYPHFHAHISFILPFIVELKENGTYNIEVERLDSEVSKIYWIKPHDDLVYGTYGEPSTIDTEKPYGFELFTFQKVGEE